MYHADTGDIFLHNYSYGKIEWALNSTFLKKSGKLFSS